MNRADLNEDISLPTIEAIVAGTLALMTGYAQAFQAEQSPQQRMLMGAKIVRNFGLLVDHPELTDPFRQVMHNLQHRWEQMCACTRLASPETEGRCGAAPNAQPESALTWPAPSTIQ